MKALTILQPYAYLVVAGVKASENRTWSVTYRGPLLIHAGTKWHNDWPDRIKRDCVIVPENELRFRGIIGVVELVDIVQQSDSRWFEGPFGWVFDRPRFLPFVEMPGKQGLFNVTL